MGIREAFTAAPGRGQRVLMWRVAMVMFLAGGVTCASGVATTEWTDAARIWQGACAGAFVLVGLVLAASGPRKETVEVSVLVSIVLIGVLVAGSNPVGMAPIFYLWPVVYAAYFCSRRMLIACYLLMMTSLGAGLLCNATDRLKLDTFTGTTMSVGLMAGLVAMMQARDHGLRRELARAAETDPLTGLLNRRAFNPKLSALIERSTHDGAALAVVLFDLDDFKLFNDTHGHLAGDEILRAMSRSLRMNSRAEDLVSRFGGEEFAVALPGADLDAARGYADRVADALWCQPVADGQGISTSAGIATLDSGIGSIDDMLSRADGALYAAKEAGRSRTGWWDGELARVGSRRGTATGRAAQSTPPNSIAA
jgi:diguanylate cyclase (GGDEF)-like protein